MFISKTLQPKRNKFQKKTKNLGHEKSEKFRRGIHKVVSEINAREAKLSERMSDYSDKKKKVLAS